MKIDDQGRQTWVASYEYQGDHTADTLRDAIMENFLFPCWIKQFQSVSHNQENELNILDSHFFKKDKKGEEAILKDENINELKVVVEQMKKWTEEELKKEVVEQIKSKIVKELKKLDLTNLTSQTLQKLTDKQILNQEKEIKNQKITQMKDIILEKVMKKTIEEIGKRIEQEINKKTQESLKLWLKNELEKWKIINSQQGRWRDKEMKKQKIIQQAAKEWETWQQKEKFKEEEIATKTNEYMIQWLEKQKNQKQQNQFIVPEKVVVQTLQQIEQQQKVQSLQQKMREEQNRLQKNEKDNLQTKEKWQMSILKREYKQIKEILKEMKIAIQQMKKVPELEIIKKMDSLFELIPKMVDGILKLKELPSKDYKQQREKMNHTKEQILPLIKNIMLQVEKINQQNEEFTIMTELGKTLKNIKNTQQSLIGYILLKQMIKNIMMFRKNEGTNSKEQKGEEKKISKIPKKNEGMQIEKEKDQEFEIQCLQQLKQLIKQKQKFYLSNDKILEKRIISNKEFVLNYIETAVTLCQLWTAQPLGEILKNQQLPQEFNVFIIERSHLIEEKEDNSKMSEQKYEGKQEKTKTYYFLIKFPDKLDNYCLKETDYLIPLERKGGKWKSKPEVKLQFTLRFFKEHLTPQKKQKYFHNTENLNLKTLQIKIFMEKQTKENLRSLGVEIHEKITEEDQSYYPIEPVINRNRIFYPYQEPTFQKTKIHMGDNFHLAFQGGGAKGLAYVGTYQAIKEYQENYKKQHKQKEAPITSIIGSSAGGIIALAISTGIPVYELEKVCYKMREIPSKDRIDSSDYKSYDDYGNELKSDDLIEKLKQVCEQLGVLKKENLESLIKAISSTDYWGEIKEKLLNLLSAAMPAVGEMLINESNHFNWQGLLMHGALMKGEAIHDIAADCLIKYLVRVRAEKGQQKFKKFLEECLGPQTQYVEDGQFVPGAKQNVKYTNHMLLTYYQASSQLFGINLHELTRIDKQEKMTVFLVGLHNTFKKLLSEINQRKDEGEKEKKEGEEPKMKMEEEEREEQAGVQSFEGHINSLLNVNGFISLESLKQQEQLSLIQQYLKLQFFEQMMEKLKKQYKQQKQFFKIDFSTLQEVIAKANQRNIKHFQNFIEKNKQSTLKEVVKMAQQKYPLLKKRCSNLRVLTLQDVIRNIEQIKQNPLRKQLSSQRKWKDIFAKIDSQENYTIQDYLKDLFDGEYSHLADLLSIKETFTSQDVFDYFEGTQSICQLIELTFDKTEKQQIFINTEYINYKETVRRLRLTVQTITMKQYYRMNKIEVSCTSVDLDNKVLRFFNHKTTPDLPVCRAVQMTGSFPVGFKAQKWQKDWGKYHVYLQDRKLEIDLTGHQFTDGGLLANFPIKYMDNQFMRERYFTHKEIMGETVLLGFGLDNLSYDRYERTVDQRNSSKEKENKISQILKELQSIFELWKKISLGWLLLCNTKKIQKQDNWSSFQSALISEIPLLRFLLKIYEAYPNADRNLNLEAFDKIVLRQELENPWMNKNSFKQNQKISTKIFLKNFLNEYHHLIKEAIQNGQNPEYNGQIIQSNVAKAINDRISENKEKLQELGTIFLNKSTRIFSGGSLETEKEKKGRENKEKEKEQEKDLEKQIILMLIKIFYTSLLIPENHQISEKYTKMYAMMKYIANEEEFISKMKETNIQTNANINITPNLTRLCFVNLFSEKDFKEISKHLNFFEYDTKLFQEFVESKQQFEAFLENKKNRSLSDLKKYSKDDFANMKLFDVTENVERVVQLIYLLIKGRREKEVRFNKYVFFGASVKTQLRLNQSEIDELVRQVRTMNCEQLLSQLSYQEILTFFKEQLKLFKQFKTSPWFKELVNAFQPKDGRNDISNFKKTFLKQFLLNIFEQKEDSKDQNPWYLGDYRFVRNCLARQDIKKIMVNKLIKDIEDNKQLAISHILYELLNKESKKENDRQSQMRKIDEFIKFVIQKVKWKADRPISEERKQNIQRLKSIMVNSIFEQTNDFFDDKQKKHIKVGAILEDFINQIYPSLRSGKKFKQKGLQNQQQVYQSLTYHQQQLMTIQDLTLLQSYLFMVEQDSIKILVTNKLQKKQKQKIFKVEGKKELKNRLTSQWQFQKEQIKNVKSIHQVYYEHIAYFLLMIKEIMIIGSGITINQEVKTAVSKIKKIYHEAQTQFLQKYHTFSELPTSLMDQISLGKAFLIKYKHIEDLMMEFESILNQYTKNLQIPTLLEKRNRKSIIEPKLQQIKEILQRQQPPEDLHQLEERKRQLESELNSINQLIYLEHVKLLIHRLKMKKFNLPLLEIEMKIITQSLNPHEKKRIKNVLKSQTKNNLKKKQKQEVHLILEGIGNSNQYFVGLYSSIQKIFSQQVRKKKSKEQRIDKEIKMITCSNFHSVFGFLHALNYSPEEIREEMYQIQFIMNEIQQPYETTKHFDSNIWAKNVSQTRHQYIQYLEKQHLSLFERLQMLKNRDQSKFSLEDEFRKIRQLFQSEKINLMKNYQLILEETSKELCTIKKNHHFSQYPVEIAKKFGLQYICQLKETHKYPQKYRNSFKTFEKLINLMYATFGHLLNGIISSKIIQNCRIDINKDNAEKRVKAVLINRLLTVYKLKYYITSKLKKAKFNPNISLLEFYQSPSTKDILLNFTVIDVNRQRLAFLNKNTTPHMPIFAAIVASSSLPFLHNMFQANKEWQAPNIENFNQAFLDDYFKPEPDSDSQITRYFSGNFISSMPLQLITNNTIMRKVFYNNSQEKAKKLGELVDYAICFDTKEYGIKTIDLPVKKNFFNFRWSFAIDLAKQYLSYLRQKVSNKLREVGRSIMKKIPIIGKQSIHYNNTYEFPQSKIKDACTFLMPWLDSTTLSSTFSTLSNSNDNFCLKWYYNKLIRLPIKVDTLEFNKIVDENILKNYKVNILSEEAAEAVERAYEISKYFIHKIHQRIALNNSFNFSDEAEIFKRIKVSFRVEFVDKIFQSTGIKMKNIKFSFLNHSKWNYNGYNNFVIEYLGDNRQQKRIAQSQFLITLNSPLIFKISFPKSKTKIGEAYYRMQIPFEDFESNRYDYQFTLHQNMKDVDLEPHKRNGIKMQLLSPVVKIIRIKEQNIKSQLKRNGVK